jgi:Family of unknown function (DUF6516)
MVDLVALERIAREEYADIVIGVYRIDAKLRMLLTDESYLDFWWSEVEQGRFAHHWNRQHVDGTIHRHDNSPHRKWQHIETFPQHYHREREEAVQASFLPTDPHEAVRAFLTFCREIMWAGGAPA